MNTALAAYREFVDALAARRECTLAKRVAEGAAWPATSELSEFNTLIAELSLEQRAKVARLLAMSREGGIHDALVVLSERMERNGLRLVEGGIELPHEPNGTEIYFDWAARCAGEAWPHEG